MSAVSTATLQEVGWKCPKDSRHNSATTMDAAASTTTTSLSQLSRNALLSIQLASIAAREFDATYALRNVERELSVPLFAGNEVVLESAQPVRSTGHFHEFGLHSLKIVMDLVIDQHDNESGGDSSVQQRRRRLADRVSENSSVYSVKYLQKQLIDSEQGPEAACEMIVEAKILMNLSHPSHPNLLQVFGANGDGIDSFLESGRKSFFLIVDRLEETLDQRLDRWRAEEQEQQEHDVDSRSSDSSTSSSNPRLLQRLEVANDICSALVFLASRELVYYLRPDKVGFDVRCGRVKLCEFGQARQEGTNTHSPRILRCTQSAVLAYTAPEVLCRSPATVSSDVYAFGILLWELWTLQRPFHAYSKSDHWTRVIQHHERPTLPPTLDRNASGSHPRQQLVELMQQCWDPHFRPTIKKVQDDLETALLFNDLPGEAMTAAGGADMDPSSTRAVSAESTKKASAEPCRGRHRGGPNIIEQHMRRTAVDPSQPNSPEVPSSGGSVATYSTYRTRGDYSAFTHGPSSPTRNMVQMQRRRRSVSRGPQKPRATTPDSALPNSENVDSAAIQRTPSSEGSGLAAGGTRKASGADTGPPSRPRRLSMEIAPKPSTRSRSIHRSRSMNIDGSGKATKILTDALSQLEHIESGDAPSTETPLTVPSSESTADPIMTSPVQRRRSSRRHPTTYPEHASKNSPTGTAATSGSSSTESSPIARTPPSTQSGTGIRAGQHRQGSIRRAESLRRLVQGDVFPDLTSPHTSESISPLPTAVPKSQCHSAPQRRRGVQRSQSLIMKPPSSGASSVLQPDATFSLDNIPQTPSPTGRVTQNRRLSSGCQQHMMLPPTRSVSGFDQLAIMQQGLQSVHENSDDNRRAKVYEATNEADSQSPVASASSPRRRMMSRALSARDMPRRHHSYSHPQKEAELPHDRRSLRAERTMVGSAETGATRESFSARLRAEMAAEATASAAAAAAAAAVQDAIAPNRAVRGKVRTRRNSYHDA